MIFFLGFGVFDGDQVAHRIDDLIDVFARLLVPFGRPLNFEGSPQIACLDIEENKTRKNGVLDRVLKKHEFAMDFRCQNERPEVVNVVLFALCLLQFMRVWVVTKFDEKRVPKWSQTIIKAVPLGAHGQVF